MPEPLVIGDLLDAVAEGRPLEAMRLVRSAATDHDPDLVVTSLLAAVQQEAGRRWEFDEWNVVDEHTTTAIVDDALAVLALVAAGDVDERGAPTLALVCAEGEWHLTPARMAATRLRLRGWRVRLLGASTPGDALARALAARRPDVVGVSCTYPANLPGARRTVKVVHDLELPAAVGGAAIDGRGYRATAIGADIWGTDLEEAEADLRGWLEDPFPLATPVLHRHGAVSRLRRAMSRLIEEVIGDLTAGHLRLGSAPVEHRARVVEAMSDTVEHIAVALDVDDPSLLDEFLAWQVGVLAVRGVTEEVLAAGLDAMGRRLEDGLEEGGALLDGARGRVGV